MIRPPNFPPALQPPLFGFTKLFFPGDELLLPQPLCVMRRKFSALTLPERHTGVRRGSEEVAEGALFASPRSIPTAL